MANTTRDTINSAMGLSQDPNYDDIQATMGGSQPGTGGGGPGAPLTITGTPPSNGRVGDSYSFAPQTAGGSGQRTYSLAGGSLLSGLMLSTATGAITGTPTVDGIISGLSVRVSDATGSAATVPGNVTIAVAGGGVVLEPNPGGGVTNIAGPITGLDATETNSSVNFIEATVAGPDVQGSGAAAGLMADGSGFRVFRMVDAGHFQGTKRNADGSLDDSNATPPFREFIAGQEPVVGDKIRMDRTTDKIVHSVIKANGDTFEVYEEAAANGSEFFGTKVALLPAFQVSYTNIVYGGAAVPLRIDNQTLTPGYKPQARLLYTGSPGADGYQCRIRSAGGSTLVDWSDAVLTDASKGAVTATSTNGVPVSEFGSNVRIDWRQKNLPSVMQTKQEAMPAGKAKIGMNLTVGGPNESVRVFKNLLQGNDGWRDGQANINPQNNPTLFNANGDLIDKGGFSPSQSFGRGTTPGTRFCVTWSGGDSPLTDVRLNGTGQNVGYSNVVTTSRRIEFDYNFSWDTQGFGRVELVNAYSGNPVTNIWVTEVTTVRDGTVFDDGYIANNVSKYDYVRLMDCMGSNASNFIPSDKPWLLEWSDRTLPSSLVFGYTGYPIEFVIELANRANVDIWIMHPAGSSPDRQTKLTRALFYGELMVGGVKLNNNIIVYDELGNEWFNSAFSIWFSARDSAIANGRGQSGNNESRLAEMAYRLNAHWTAIAGNFPAGRLKKLVMGNPSDTYDGQVLDQFGATDYDFYGSAYYIMNVKFEDAPNLWPGQNIQALFDFAYSTITTGLATLKSNRDFATSKGKGFWVYEGQQHWVEPRQTMPYADQAFYTQFQQDARMEGLMTAWFDSFTSNFDGGLTCFNAFGLPSARYGSWGFTNDQADTSLVKSPKQRALLSAVQRLSS